MNQPKTPYSIGFAISHDGQRVLLLQKGRPAFLAGSWIGVGGHVEPGETAHQAMVREAREEADIEVPIRYHLCDLDRPASTIAAFAAFTDLSPARTMTDEPVQVFDWEQLDNLNLSDATREVLTRLQDFAARRRIRPPRP